MRKQIAILCLAMFFITLFVAAAHDHGASGPLRDCPICLMPCLMFAAAQSDVHISQSFSRSTSLSPTVINLPETFLARLDARSPPAA
jgi:hypothetical protein